MPSDQRHSFSQLEERLGKLTAKVRDLAAVVHFNGETRAYSAPGDTGFNPDTPVHIGCMAKSLTATLMATAIEEGRLTLEDVAIDLLSRKIPSDGRGALPSGIRLHHLLNHSHGLDDPSLKFSAHDSRGFIDVTVLLDFLARRPPIAAPGVVFNYSSIGYWLAGAVLECVHDRPYTELLIEKVLKPSGIPARGLEVPGAIACAATGGSLLLTAHELLALTRMHLTAGSDRENVLALLRGELSFVHKEWHPSARRVCLGWFDHGHGCFGHTARGSGDSAAIRFFPDIGAAVVITATKEYVAPHFMNRLLSGMAGGEDSGMGPTRPLSRNEWAAIDARSYIGKYENNQFVVEVALAFTGSLEARVFKRIDGKTVAPEPYLRRYLTATTNNAFFPSPPEPIVLGILRFSENGPSGQHRYLHTFSRTLTRCESGAS